MTNKELEEYKKEERSLKWIILGYFYGAFSIFFFWFMEKYFMIVGICLILATLLHHKQHRKRFKK